MKTLGFFFAIIVLLVGGGLVGFVAYHGWFVAIAVIEGAKTLEPKIYVPLVVTVFSAAIGLIAALYTQSSIRKREIEEAHRNRKIEIYYGFLKLVQKMLLAQKEGFEDQAVDEKELLLMLSDFRVDITLWASPKVLNSFQNFLSVSAGRSSSKELLSQIDPLYKAMRRDIGLSNTGLENHYFAKSMLIDPSEFDQL
ncbi:hypothetical protein [Ruegeria arenilitoris]|uniref:hypothetical protein n=1 Tax=Ruegeria arenilitoris TaxID=1173585 RepID=UPI00147A0FF3|nr:hypothetical protein [Ruegeria arenilitoris]